MPEIGNRSGFKFVLALPEGYDERTRMQSFRGTVIVVHPDFPPCIVEDNKLVPLEPSYEAA